MTNKNTIMKTKQEMQEHYQLWIKKATGDADLIEELNSMNTDSIEDAFYKDLEFGTGGLRGIIGAGTNRINIYTVAKASQGLSDYVKKYFPKGNRMIAVSYDSRIKSDIFARTAASVFASNGIKVFIYDKIMPTPCLSFAVRFLGCAAGIMITASHNPSQYNGYKVYGSDGCQITTKAAAEILKEIEKLDIFEDIQFEDFSQLQEKRAIEYIPDIVYDDFINEVKSQSMLDEKTFVDKNISIIYSPLNGTGLKPVLRTLEESGYTNVTIVKEQEKPDGTFPTCPYPNPEDAAAMALGIEYAKKENTDLVLATDPDCDRIGISVKNLNGDYILLSGNETGMLLLDYICSRRREMKTMPEDPIIMKTIVTIDMAERIAEHYGVRTVNVLTGFKFIGEKISFLESKKKKDSFIFGMEESYGYLSGTYVRDKDGVSAALLICEMYAYYKSQGLTLYEKLENLYQTYGFCLNSLHSFKFEGYSGLEEMQKIMKILRKTPPSFLGKKELIDCMDYSNGLDDLPKSNVLKFLLEDHCSIVIRPSGTEPKLKIYISANAETREKAEEIENQILLDIEKYIFPQNQV